jgi:hypothetical protein
MRALRSLLLAIAASGLAVAAAACSDDTSAPGSPGATSAGGSGGASTSGGPGTGAASSGGSGAVGGSAASSGGSGGSGGSSAPIEVIFEEGWEAGTGAWVIEGACALESDPSRVRSGASSLRVDFRDPACGPASCDDDGQNCFENYPQVVSQIDFDLERFYMSWWVYYPEDFIFYDGPCMPVRGMQGHFVRFSNFHTPPDPNDSFYQATMPDFGQYRADEQHLGIRAEWQWIENDTGAFTIGRNLVADPIATADLVGKWSRYEIFVDLGTPGGSDGAIAWAVNDVVRFDVHDDQLFVGAPIESVWGDEAAEAEAHPGMLRTSGEGFTRLGLVSNPNSSFGGRPSDVYWIDDVVVAGNCPADRTVCAPFAR